MLCGNADIETLAVDAARVPAFFAETISLEDVVCFQMTAEMKNSARESQLPAGLHPTVPAALSVQAFSVGNSPWGSFHFVTVRVSCRSGVRARGFTRAVVVSTEEACEGLRTLLGFPARTGQIHFRHGYDGVSVRVESAAGERLLGIEAIDPEPMAVQDVQYTGTLNLAETPNGLRLMQVEMLSEARQVERVKARLESFQSTAWGSELLVPTRVIAATVARLSIEFPPIRFVCKPDELAFTGTEAVSTGSGGTGSGP